MMNLTAMDTTGGNYFDYNLVYPYPGNPIPPIINPPWTTGTTTLTWQQWDEQRIAALEARLAKMERENRRLKRGLSRLYRERRLRQTEAR